MLGNRAKGQLRIKEKKGMQDVKINNSLIVRQINNYSGMQCDTKTNGQTHRKTDRQTDRQTGRQADRQTDTDRQTVIYYDTLTYKLILTETERLIYS